MEKHPDGEPCRAKAVNGGDDDYRDCDQYMFDEGIYGATSSCSWEYEKRC
jgi:hypothetical protein